MYENQIEGRNPVLEALRSDEGRIFIEKLYILKSSKDGPILSIIRKAKARNIQIDFVDNNRLNQMSETKKHQGVIAKTTSYNYYTLEELLNSKKNPSFFVILDDIVDPHNLGNIIRTSNCLGVDGVIIHDRHAASLTPTAIKASAGALSYIKVAKVTNISKTIDKLKEEGIWVIGADMDGSIMYDVDFKGNIAIVIGNEGEGLSRLVKEKCDLLAAVPQLGSLNSLNASVAFGVIGYEAFRQRR